MGRSFLANAIAIGTLALGLTVSPTAPLPALAHSGGLDSLGCHHDRKADGYHCHRGALAGWSFGSKAKAQRALQGPPPATPSAPATSPSQPSPAATAAPVPYSRDLYRHWVDADSDCQDTCQEVLIVASRVPVQIDPSGCRVLSGRWFDSYTGETVTNPRQLDIDHLVPLAEAHRSGADRWDAARRQAYANDLDHPDTLIAVSAGANRSKGDKDPARWMPPNAAYHCDYIAAWIAVKVRWGLGMDGEKLRAVAAVRIRCAR